MKIVSDDLVMEVVAASAVDPTLLSSNYDDKLNFSLESLSADMLASLRYFVDSAVFVVFENFDLEVNLH